MTTMRVEDAWDYLVDMGLASEETLRVVTDINGYSIETMEDVLYATSGEREFEDTDDEDDEEEE